MTAVLVLGATGRTGSAFLRHRTNSDETIYAGVRRDGSGGGERALPGGADGVRIVDVDDVSGMRAALTGIDVVVNAMAGFKENRIPLCYWVENSAGTI